MLTKNDIDSMTRDEVIEFLESWGYQCYDYESTSYLKECAYEHVEEGY